VVATADALTRLAKEKQHEVIRHKREIKKHRRELQVAAQELKRYKRRLAALGITLLSAE